LPWGRVRSCCLRSIDGIEERCSRQQPDGDDTPGVAAAPVALAGAIVPGVARSFIIVFSAHADVFGVGTTVIVGPAVVGSMLVLPSCVISG
jgi:hypothetical protein